MQVKTFMRDPTSLTKACQLAKEDAQDCGQFVAKHRLGEDILVQVDACKVGAASSIDLCACPQQGNSHQQHQPGPLRFKACCQGHLMLQVHSDAPSPL